MRKAKKMRCLGNAQISFSTDTCSCAWLTLKVKQVVWPNPINVYQPYLNLIWDQGKCQNSNHNFWISDFTYDEAPKRVMARTQIFILQLCRRRPKPFFSSVGWLVAKSLSMRICEGVGKGSKVVGIRCHPLSRVHPHLPDCPIPS